MRIFIAAVAVLLAGVVMAQAYRWVDEDGIVHYSDKPHEGAEEIQLPGSSNPNRRYIPVSVGVRRQNNQEIVPFKYETIVFVSPAAEETLWNIEGQLQVSLALNPALQPGHQLRIYLDGVPRNVTTTSFSIDEVYRGEHTIRAEVRDRAGRFVGQSASNTFYVQQNSIIRPN